ncbi:MAG TPA: alpha/beta fold hydrolase [Flavobacteriaceae bacterium]|nr:alpha/beta fold hydrolase [Flavobacteriaceae bacterium]
MISEKQFVIEGQHDKPILLDVTYPKTNQPKQIIIFCHGYKGFKDWGAWNLVADKFAENDFFFIKFNFSHNGGTIENPIDFPDLEAFAQDNFSKQLDDLQSVIDWILTTKEFLSEADVQNLNLIGHSRGGGIVLIKAAENKQVKKIATWASVNNFDRAFPTGKELEKWKENGVRYVENSRTKQQLPHNYQFYEDFKKNEDRFDFKKASRQVKTPFLIVHAKDDTTVKFEDAKKLHRMNSKSELFIIPKGGHTFGAKHPWQKERLPESLKKTVDKTAEFFKAGPKIKI